MSFFEDYFESISPEPNTGCWLWIGGLSGARILPSGTYMEGYGRIGHRGIAHRIAYEDVYGKGSADGLVVRHRCDNPPCVNPDHLLVGTHKDNSMDAIARNRIKRRVGERHHKTKITRETASKIIELAETTNAAEIARVLGVADSIVNDILTGRAWTHLSCGKIIQRKYGFTRESLYGERNYVAKLTNDDVRAIRTRLAAGEKQQTLAEEYGVSKSAISAIKTGKNWSTI